MALHAFDQELQTAITYIAAPAINGSLLTAAPQVAVLLHGLTLLTACLTDVSLNNSDTKHSIHLLKTPGSFRASLYQTANEISKSFRTADQAMFVIYLNLRDVPQIMTSVVNSYAQPNDPAASFLMNLELRHLSRIALLCRNEAEKTTSSFGATLELIKELQQITISTKGDNESKVTRTNKLLEEYNTRMQALEREKEDLRAQIEEQEKKVIKAEEKYDKASERMSNDLVVLSAILEDGVRTLLSLFNIGSSEKKSENGNDKTEYQMTDSAVGNLHAATLIAKEMYLKQVQLQQINLKKDEANRRALVEIAITIMSTDADKLNLKEILESLSAGIKMLGEVQAHWSTLRTYFSKLESIILHLTTHLKRFDEIVKVPWYSAFELRELQKEDMHGSELLRKQMTRSGIEAAGLCISVLREAKIYNDLSSYFIMPLIDGSAKNLGLSTKEAKALSLRTAQLLSHGNSLMADFRHQGQSIHQLAFQQKHVAARIQSLIENFESHEVMKKPKDAMAILKEAEISFKQIKENVDRIDAREIELSKLIQQILERMKKGEEDSKAINQTIEAVSRRVRANSDSIRRTKETLSQLSGDLRDLEGKLQKAEENSHNSNQRVIGFSIITALSLGIGGIWLKPALEHRNRVYAENEAVKIEIKSKWNEIRNLEESGSRDEEFMDELRNSLRSENREMESVKGVLNRLQSTHNESLQCRQFLFSLAHELTNVNTCVQKMNGYLADTSEILANNASVPISNEWRLNQSFQELNETWSLAIEKPALEIVQHLVDPDSVDATLKAITSAKFNLRFRRDLDTFLIY